MSTRFEDPDLLEHADARDAPDADSVPEEVLAAYDFAVKAVEPHGSRSYNIHFRVETGRGLMNLRRSNRPSNPANLLYEAALLGHIRQKGFLLAPRVVLTRDGRPNAWHDGVGWTMFEWLGDGPKVVSQEISPERTRHAAQVLAALHTASSDFRPRVSRGDWPIFAGPENWNRRWLPRAESLSRLLGEDGAELWDYAGQVAAGMDAIDCKSLSTTVCHADYRPRNLRFDGERVSAVFDLDTAFRTTRLLDLGGAVTRFSAAGGDPQADTESGSLFLRTYDAASPLNDHEWAALPAFIRWRLVREVVVYYDKWWLDVRPACRALFDGVAEKIVAAARG